MNELAQLRVCEWGTVLSGIPRTKTPGSCATHATSLALLTRCMYTLRTKGENGEDGETRFPGVS
jgi:hypothetical protein